jgi:cytochrome b561
MSSSTPVLGATSQFESQPGGSNLSGSGAKHLKAALPWAKYLHWVTALMFVGMFLSGVVMTQIGGGATGDLIMGAHKLFGVLILALFAARLLYRIAMQMMGRWPKNSGTRLIHGLLYATGLAVPLLGWAAISDIGARTVLGGITLPKIWPEGAGYADLLFSAHAWLAFLFMAIVVAHIGFALHDYVTRGADAARDNPLKAQI